MTEGPRELLIEMLIDATKATYHDIVRTGQFQFKDVELDSLTLQYTVLEIEDAFGIQIEDEEAYGLKSFDDVHQLLMKKSLQTDSDVSPHNSRPSGDASAALRYVRRNPNCTIAEIAQATGCAPTSLGAVLRGLKASHGIKSQRHGNRWGWRDPRTDSIENL
ncbi:MAG: acyl carrier protein [Armatimonadota bacterium]|nr:acyl carrier protein [Armatimonadota bacterium]